MPLLAETFEREVPILARRHLVLVNTPQPPGLKPLFADESAADLDSLYAGLGGQWSPTGSANSHCP